MIGISQIGIYIPECRVDNRKKVERHNVTEDFLVNKIGIRFVSVKAPSDATSDLCVYAFRELKAQNGEFDERAVDCLCVCTQNGDYRLPQTSSIVHNKLGLPSECASFDISLGCSGYVYSLTLMKSFMEANELKCGVLFTCDPYSTIIDPDDRNTDLLFGDAATATLLRREFTLRIGKGVFETDSENFQALIKRKDEKLIMDGRTIFNFAMRHVPLNVGRCLELNSSKTEDVDLFLFHQASKYVVENIKKRMKLDTGKVPFGIIDYGNTVSSSIPILLKEYLGNKEVMNIMLTGFGVGLSIGSVLLRRA